MNVMTTRVELEGSFSQHPTLTQCVEFLAQSFSSTQFIGVGFVQAKPTFIHCRGARQASSGQCGRQTAGVSCPAWMHGFHGGAFAQEFKNT